VLTEEVFGPLLTIERVADVEHAMEIVEGLPYALTGGLFARDPATIRRVRDRTPVGNLYVNRGITGAKVGRQPFGGNRLSGNGLKAGGPGYLLGFLEPRATTENTMRHGLVV
jgi:RHH-type proline utilization regulon transcriptional repressor/proline dehydrogenase/delta 1-pyrroline-5-carboxylate dehydrogenase